MTSAYDEYLRSPWWRARKNLLLRYRGERCEHCGSGDSLEMHHRTYERLFRELPDDLELLCHSCHQDEHGRPGLPSWNSRLDIQRLDFDGARGGL